MRHRKGYIVLSEERDVPLLLEIRNARAITFDQICSLSFVDCREHDRRSVHWRVTRLEKEGLVQRVRYDRFVSQPIFAITSLGLEFLESRGHYLLSLPSTTKEIVRISQILHSIELTGIRLALAQKGILQSWKSEIEITSKNLVYGLGTTKDFDALVEISLEDRTKTLAIEFERTLKGAARYEELREVFNAEQSTDTVLYLTPNPEILYVLAVEMRNVGKRIGFAISKTFQSDLLDARILTNSSSSDVLSFRQFLAA